MIRGKFLLKNVMKIQHVHVSVVIESLQSNNLYLTSLYFSLRRIQNGSRFLR